MMSQDDAKDSSESLPSATAAVSDALQKRDIHDQWENTYRTAENILFYQKAIDSIVSELDPLPTARFLDAGCGICDYSIRIAEHGVRVVAVDFSENVLEVAKAKLENHPAGSLVELRKENLLDLSFADGAFDHVMCWGVLMHIPDVATAIGELARVVRPGGSLVVSESNMHSLESMLLRAARGLRGSRSAQMRRTEAGWESWAETSAGTLVTRDTDISWLIDEFAKHGLHLRKRVACQFSEMYGTTTIRPFRSFFYGLNNLWFDRIRSPRGAFGNLIYFDRAA